MPHIGSHVSFSHRGLLGAVAEATRYGAQTFMVYTGAPQNTVRKPIQTEHVVQAYAEMEARQFASFVVHAPYIVNLASYKEDTRDLAVRFLQQEIHRTEQLGARTIVLHPGAYTDRDAVYGISRIAEGLQQVLTATQHTGVTIALETMAGKGTEIGRTFDELAQIIAQVPLQERLRVCLDTCHVHDAGYDIIHDWNGVLSAFDQTLGLDRLAVLHLNDSKNACGAGKDRHAPIGAGWIGYEAIARIVQDERVQHLPMILETPWIGKNAAQTAPMYTIEIALLLDEVEERMGASFVADVAVIDQVLRLRGYTPVSIRSLWEQFKGDAKARKADPREPLEQLYDLVVQEQLFPDLAEAHVLERIVCWLSGRCV